jgi:MHS family shikimate/dehydroshikimate transporter-like MFS transporter
MDKGTRETVGGEAEIAKIASASLVGTSLELYDFYIYGTAAALVFGQLFFPTFDPLAGTLAAFATFGVAFIARPLGGIIFGHFGDKVGRKTMLVVTLVLMGVCTFLVGLLPGYDAIGIAAPLLLVLLRFMQGLGLGGEWGGAVLIAAEHAPAHRRGFYASFPQLGPTVGIVLSSGVFLLLTGLLSEEQLLAWGWRVPFLLSIVVVAVGLYIRLRIAETPAFRRIVETHTESGNPILDVIRTHTKNLLLAAGASSFLFSLFYITVTFMVSYGTGQLGLSLPAVLYAVAVAGLGLGLGVPVFAHLSDRIGRRKLCLAGAVFCGLWGFPLFWLVDTGSWVLITLALAVGQFGSAAAYGPLAAFFSELFSARLRYSGTSLSYNLGGILGGALAPLIATQLLASTGTTLAISVYLAVMAVVSFVCILLLSEVYQTEISEV